MIDQFKASIPFNGVIVGLRLMIIKNIYRHMELRIDGFTSAEPIQES